MDYTKVPRALIYKDRDDLKDFDVLVPGTINHFLFSRMREITLLHCGNAKEIALQCLNNAYYICTLTQLEDFPDLCMDKYENKLMKVEIPFSGDVYQASMALVCVLLAAYDDKYKKKDNPLIESIRHWTSSNKWTGSLCHKSFDDIINTCNTDGFILHQSDIAPRDITDVINNVSVYNLVKGKEYVHERIMLLGDRSCINSILEKAISRIDIDIHEQYEEWGYNPKTGVFEDAVPGTFGADYNTQREFLDEIEERKDAISYFEKFFKLEPQGIENLISTLQNSQITRATKPIPETTRQADKTRNDGMTEKTKPDASMYEKRIRDLELENTKLKNENYNLKSDNEELRKESDSNKKVKELEDELERIKERHQSTLIALLKPTFYDVEKDARDFLEKIKGLDNEGVADVMNQFANQNKVVQKRKKRRTWEILTAARLYSAEEQTWSFHMRKSD